MISTLGRCLVLTFFALCPLAQETEEPRPARGLGGLSNFPPARQVARAADANRDGEVSREEWNALLSALEIQDDGLLRSSEFLARAVLPMIERSEDGSFDLDDLFLSFGSMDRNKDDALEELELSQSSLSAGTRTQPASPGGSSLSMAVLSVRPADANDDGFLDPDEWGAFIDSIELERDGSIGLSTLSAWIEHELAHDPHSKGFEAASILRWVQGGIDADGDGWTDVKDLQSLFDSLDDEGDGQLTKEEMRFGRGSGRGGVSERDRAKPALMPWQRNLEDALALVQASGQPLLICVNMDNEFASESFAWSRYRNPKFVELVAGFVPLLVSPNRHNLRDYDDRGRRITDQRFGRLVNAEHIDIEAQLYERYFDGKRSAPRHLGISPDGQVLFDIYLDNDLSLVDAALREHGQPSALGKADLEPHELSEEELLASPDAACREVLEQLFQGGDLRQRVRLAGLSLSSTRPTQHPELLRMALADGESSVRLQAVWAMAQHPAQAPLAAFAEAYRIAAADARAGDALFAALGQRDQPAARELQRALAGMRASSAHVDVLQWRTAISWAPLAAAPEELSRERLIEQLQAVGGALAGNLDDPERNLAFAAASMRSAQLAIREGRSPKLLLADVIAAGQRASKASPADGRALAYAAWAQHMLSDPESASRSAIAALPQLLPWAGTPLAARVLELFAELRMRAVLQAKQTEAAWEAAWVADVRAAHEVLLSHPYGNEQQALAYVEFLNVLGLTGPQTAVLCASLERFPLSGQLHARLREQILRDGTAAELEGVYDTLTLAPKLAAERRWYEGLACFEAAERHVANRSNASAQSAYRRSAELFSATRASQPEYAEPASQYVCLALAGLARLQVEKELLSEALINLCEGVVANPETVWKRDGLGNSPRETAMLLYRSLLDNARDKDAEQLRSFLAEKGLEIEG